uniref:PHD-type domain-containing protein n=1 Tax=Panagrellus redivivus TaxID=6233 RepID=A0A7E4V6T6_PANRE
MPPRTRRTPAANARGRPKRPSTRVRREPDDSLARATVYLTRASERRQELTTEANDHQVRMVSALMLEVKRDEERKKDPASALCRELEAMLADTPDPFTHGRAAIELMKQRAAIAAEARERLALEVARRDAVYKAWWKKTRREQKARRRAMKAEQIQRRMERLRELMEERERNGTAESEEVVAEASPSNEGVDPNEPRYCYCNDVAHGRMVGCDNESCKLEWFHFACVGLEDDPVDDWYCRYCTPPAEPEPVAPQVKRPRGRPRKDGMVRTADGQLISADSEPVAPKEARKPKTVKSPSVKKPATVPKSTREERIATRQQHQTTSTVNQRKQTRSAGIQQTNKAKPTSRIPKKTAKPPPQRSPTKNLDPVPEVKIKVSPQTVAKSKLRTSARRRL